MAKKRKSAKKSAATSPVTVSKKPNWKNAWRTPLLPEKYYYSFLANCGHVITLSALITAALLFLGGYLTRPAILEENLITKLLYPEKYGGFQPLAAYPNQQSGRSPLTNYEAFWFQFGPNSPAGFVIPRKVLHIPDQAKKIGLCIIAAYKGIPYLKYGFASKKHTMEDIGYHLGGIRLELLPTPKEIKMTTMLPDYNAKETFEVPWDRAEYFYFLMSADVLTEMHFIKIAVLEE